MELATTLSGIRGVGKKLTNFEHKLFIQAAVESEVERKETMGTAPTRKLERLQAKLGKLLMENPNVGIRAARDHVRAELHKRNSWGNAHRIK